MKKILTLLVFATASIVQLQAQTPTPAGTLFLGGGISYSTENSNTITTIGNTTITNTRPTRNTLEISPTLGYMLTNNWAIGIAIGINSTSDQSFNGNGNIEEENITRLTTLNPFARYYYALNERVSIFGQGSLGFGFGSNEQIEYDNNRTTTTTRFDVNTFDISLRPGLTVFVTDKIALEGTIGRIGYGTTRLSRENFERNDDEFQFAITPREFSLGIFYWFK